MNSNNQQHQNQFQNNLNGQDNQTRRYNEILLSSKVEAYQRFDKEVQIQSLFIDFQEGYQVVIITFPGKNSIRCFIYKECINQILNDGEYSFKGMYFENHAKYGERVVMDNYSKIIKLEELKLQNYDSITKINEYVYFTKDKIFLINNIAIKNKQIENGKKKIKIQYLIITANDEQESNEFEITCHSGTENNFDKFKLNKIFLLHNFLQVTLGNQKKEISNLKGTGLVFDLDRIKKNEKYNLLRKIQKKREQIEQQKQQIKIQSSD